MLETLLAVALVALSIPVIIESIKKAAAITLGLYMFYDLFKNPQSSGCTLNNEIKNQKETREVLNSLQKDSGTEWQDISRKEQNYSIAL